MKTTHYMRYFLLFAATLFCLTSCSRHSEHWKTINDMDAIIEERPDSVLNVLQSIDTDELASKEERAKHALLLSMALDKNVIDKTDFEVLQPAIDYYEDNGSATDKLRTYYYQGRIYQNAGNDAAAMTSFVNALDKGAESNDKLTKARTLVAQSTIYYSLMKWDKVYYVSSEAANYYFELGRVNNYVLSLLRRISGCLQSNNYSEAIELLDKCYQYIEDLPESTVSEIYSYNLLCLSRSDDKEGVRRVIDEYIEQVADSNIDYLAIAGAYTDIGAYSDAENIAQKIDVNRLKDDYRVLKYYATLLKIYEHQGDFKSANETYIKFNELNDKIVFSIFESDTQFVEERHNLEMQKAKETEAKNRLTIIVLGCAVALMASLYIINLIRKRLKKSRVENAQLLSEKALYEQMYNEVVAERDALNTIKEEAIEIIKKRLGVLNTIIVSYVSAKETDVKRANEELEHLIANREEFIRSTRLTLEDNYPHFLAYLRDKGLEEHEIDFCCLYAIGMKGKEVKAYTNLSRHYKDSSEVRHKLGLTESDTNLSNFLQKLLKNAVE